MKPRFSFPFAKFVDVLVYMHLILVLFELFLDLRCRGIRDFKLLSIVFKSSGCEKNQNSMQNLGHFFTLSLELFIFKDSFF